MEATLPTWTTEGCDPGCSVLKTPKGLVVGSVKASGDRFAGRYFGRGYLGKLHWIRVYIVPGRYLYDTESLAQTAVERAAFLEMDKMAKDAAWCKRLIPR